MNLQSTEWYSCQHVAMLVFALSFHAIGNRGGLIGPEIFSSQYTMLSWQLPKVPISMQEKAMDYKQSTISSIEQILFTEIQMLPCIFCRNEKQDSLIIKVLHIFENAFILIEFASQNPFISNHQTILCNLCFRVKAV